MAINTARRWVAKKAARFFTRLRNNYLLFHPGLLTFLSKRFPKLKARVVVLLQGGYRSKEEQKVDLLIKAEMRIRSFRELVLLAEEDQRKVFNRRLSDLGFWKDHYLGGADFYFNFYLKEKGETSVVKVVDERGKIVFYINERAFDRNVFRFFMHRLLVFGAGYMDGIKRVLDHEEQIRGQRIFYMSFEDGFQQTHERYIGEASIYAFCREVDDLSVGLLPDIYTIWDAWNEPLPREYANREEAQAEFNSRERKIFWRGSTTGFANGDDIYSNKRINFCITALQYPDIADAKIAGIVQNFAVGSSHKKMKALNILGERVTEEDFAHFTSHADLEGNTAAWGAIRKYLRCIHIFKPVQKYSHFFDFYQDENCFTRFTDGEQLFSAIASGELPVADFDIAYNGYQAALRAREAVRSGTANIFPDYRPKNN